MRRTALLAVLVMVVVSGAGGARNRPSIELGDLRAIPSSGPALVFQVPLLRPAHAPLDTPTVVVRRPSDVLFFVGNNMLELRMLELADVELEIIYAGQTVNRLLLKTELQAARARMAPGIVQERYQEAQSRGIKGGRLARLSQETGRAQQERTRVDPDGAGDQRRRVASDRKRLIGAGLGREESVGLGGGPHHKAEGESSVWETRLIALEREMVGIREGIQGLVGHVATLADVSHRAGEGDRGEQRTFSRVLAVTLGGLLVAAAASLLTGYSVQRRALHRERQRRRVLVAAIERARDALPTARLGLPGIEPPPPGGMESGVELEPRTSMVRRVRVSYKASRRVHVRGSQEKGTSARLTPSERVPLVPPHTPTAIPEISDSEITLANLRRELINVQKRSLSQPAQVKQIQALLAKLTEMAKKT